MKIAVVAVLLLGCITSAIAQHFWPVDVGRSYSGPIMLQAKGANPVQISGAHVTALVDAYSRVIRQVHANPTLLITDMNAVNAFAGPTPKGPIVAVTVPMLRLLGEDRDAWGALLGHELAHLYHNHSAQTRNRQELINLFAKIINENQAARGHANRVPWVNLAATLTDRKFSRDHEREADATGLDFMVRAGLNPHGAIRLHTRFSEIGGGGGIAFLETHPTSQERIKNMTAQINEKYRTATVTAAYAPAPAAAPPPTKPSSMEAFQLTSVTLAEGRRVHSACASEAHSKGLQGADLNIHVFRCIDSQAPSYSTVLSHCSSTASEANIPSGAERNQFIGKCVEAHERTVPGDHWFTYCGLRAQAAGAQGTPERQAAGNQCLDQQVHVKRAAQECWPSFKDQPASRERHIGYMACIRGKVPKI